MCTKNCHFCNVFLEGNLTRITRVLGFLTADHLMENAKELEAILCRTEESENGGVGSNSPILSLLSLTEQGLVLLSRENFEVGCQLRMGLHVRLRRQGSSGESHFVDIGGFVVRSLPHNSRGRALFELTLLFDGVSAEERRILTSVPSDAIEARACRGMTEYEAFLLGEKTPSVVGLN